MIVKSEQIAIPKNYDLKRDGITQSLILSFLKCRKEFIYIVNGWKPEEKKEVFATGTLVHDILDKIYTYYKTNKIYPNLSRIKRWIETFDKENKDWLDKSDKENKDFIKAVVYTLVTEYIKYYKKDFKEFTIAGAEETFNVNFEGYTLRGKKDLRFKIHNKIWIMETKTLSRIDEEDLSEKIAFDFQSLFYTVCEEIEHNEEVVGVIYNVIRNPGHKPKTGETLFQFQNRLRKEIRKNPSHFFKRWSIPFTKKDKDNFKKELLYKLNEIEDLLNGKLKIYKNEKNCVTRFRCGFLRACSSGQMVGYTNDNKLFSELM